MSDDVVAIKERIKSRGYWEVDIRPNEPFSDRFDSLRECREIVQECVVLIRGWDYPHFGNDPAPYPMVRRIESYVDFGSYKEFWTMFINGHFYHIFACKEDWLRERSSVFGRGSYDHIEPGITLGFIMTLYNVTEIFEFASRLAQKNVLGKNVRIQITLHGMQVRELRSYDPKRFLRGNFRSREKTIPLEVKISADELIGNGRDVAVDTTIQIYELFNWLDVSKGIISEAQLDFYEKRF